jgi:hypothetical protein
VENYKRSLVKTVIRNKKSIIGLNGDDADDVEGLGDVTQEQWDFPHLDIDENSVIDKTPFSDLSEENLRHPDAHLLSIMMQPDYFGWTCSKLFNTAISENGLELLPMQCAVLRELWYRPFPIFIGSRGFSKSFLLAIYCLLRALFIQGRRIIIVGSGFRQAKIIFGYAETIWRNSPIYRELCGVAYDRDQGPHHDTDMWTMNVGESVIRALPIGTGEKIRGQRGNDIIADEFRTIDRGIFEEVIAGFGAVNIDPVQQVKFHKRMKYLKKINRSDKEISTKSGLIGNQLIISGTPGFAFEHFFGYWKKQKDIILSKGNKKILHDKGIDTNVDYKNYSIFRIPVDLLPEGFMSEENVLRSKSTMAVGVYDMEYGACFTADSTGFFRRSAIEAAVPTYNNPVLLPSGELLNIFTAKIKGEINQKYIMGVDAASERDKFAIVIVEHHDDHARVAYCWTTDRKTHLKMRDGGLIKEKDFYTFCVRKIRDLMKAFNIIHIAIDAMGGGRTISEALHNEAHLQAGERLIWEINESSIFWDGQERQSDRELGLHIVELCQFANEKYTSYANHGMKHDLEQRILLFPYSDPIEIALAGKADLDAGRAFDTLDEVVAEIDELKDELQTIQRTSTPTGREHWGAPKIKDNLSAGQLYDDRYCALLMANTASRRIRLEPKQEVSYVAGGFASQFTIQNFEEKKNEPLYVGPSWFVEGLKNVPSYGMVVPRGTV